jgi:hypothetical protein
MSVFRRATSSDSQLSAAPKGGDGLAQLGRFVGRVLLWGCVVLLLVRGIASYFTPTSDVVTEPRGVTVTVTQPAHTEPSTARRK